MTLDQLALVAPSLVALDEIDRRDANRLLDRFGHYLGPCNRPFGQQAWTLRVAGEPVAVAVSASTVSATVPVRDVTVDGEDIVVSTTTYSRTQLVELARLASSEQWATRVMLRLWREVCAPTWPHWQVEAAIAYSANERHPGHIYRADGWKRGSDKAGSSGGGTWTKKRAPDDAVSGAKTLWVWRYTTKRERAA